MSDFFKYKGYIGSIRTSIEDECLYGKVEFINDLIMYEGGSINELRAAFEEALDSYLSFCKENNKEPNQTFKGSFNIRIGEELHRAAAVAAAKSGINLNEFVKKAIQEKLSSEKQVIHKHEHFIINDHKTKTFSMS